MVTTAAIRAKQPPDETSSISFATADCSLGTVLVARSERGVCAIAFGDEALDLVSDLRRQLPDAELVESASELVEILAEVVAATTAPATSLDLGLDTRGTPFQEEVWRALASIPPGQTTTYAELAQRIGRPNAIQAVGQACGANRIALAIPCHRVVRSDGSLAGYRWGIERKRALLEREGRASG